jgi:tetratricopeptide (TPR) repeat protein
MANRFFTIALFLLICSQVAGQRATRQSAQEAFDKGVFRKAYTEFTELLEVYSRDPLYKYYASVSLIKLEQDTEQAETLIREAIESNTAARAIPADATFYHARVLHMNGKFDEAVREYQRFADRAGRRTAREFRVPAYIQQCTRGEGEIVKEQPAQQITPEYNEPKTTEKSVADILFAMPEFVAEKEEIKTPPAQTENNNIIEKISDNQI